jgi:bacteriocin biosynthesis cyclodehydratase domain-containing protein
MRPLLKPALRRLWRDPFTLQLGVDPRYAVVVSGVEVTDAGLLDLFDGTRELAEIGAEATRQGHGAQRANELVRLLGSAAALDDGAHPGAGPDPRLRPDLLSLSLVHPAPGAAHARLAERARRAAQVFGAGRVGATVAMLLDAAGVGAIAVNDGGRVRPTDLSPGGIRTAGTRANTRADAVRLALHPQSAASAPSGSGHEAAIAVLAPAGAVIPPEWLSAVADRPHLPVVVREATAVIGPLVLPGRTPCVRCLELARRDRDPAWPLLAAQLAGEPETTDACDIALASAAASLAALHVLAWLDDGDHAPDSAGATIELSLSDLRLRRRSVSAHPACGCGAYALGSEPT